jgi:hypothetical protein
MDTEAKGRSDFVQKYKETTHIEFNDKYNKIKEK